MVASQATKGSLTATSRVKGKSPRSHSPGSGSVTRQQTPYPPAAFTSAEAAARPQSLLQPRSRPQSARAGADHGVQSQSRGGSANLPCAGKIVPRASHPDSLAAAARRQAAVPSIANGSSLTVPVSAKAGSLRSNSSPPGTGLPSSPRPLRQTLQASVAELGLRPQTVVCSAKGPVSAAEFGGAGSAVAPILARSSSPPSPSFSCQQASPRNFSQDQNAAFSPGLDGARSLLAKRASSPGSFSREQAAVISALEATRSMLANGALGGIRPHSAPSRAVSNHQPQVQGGSFTVAMPASRPKDAPGSPPISLSPPLPMRPSAIGSPSSPGRVYLHQPSSPRTQSQQRVAYQVEGGSFTVPMPASPQASTVFVAGHQFSPRSLSRQRDALGSPPSARSPGLPMRPSGTSIGSPASPANACLHQPSSPGISRQQQPASPVLQVDGGSVTAPVKSSNSSLKAKVVPPQSSTVQQYAALSANLCSLSVPVRTTVGTNGTQSSLLTRRVGSTAELAPSQRAEGGSVRVSSITLGPRPPSSINAPSQQSSILTGRTHPVQSSVESMSPDDVLLQFHIGGGGGSVNMSIGAQAGGSVSMPIGAQAGTDFATALRSSTTNLLHTKRDNRLQPNLQEWSSGVNLNCTAQGTRPRQVPSSSNLLGRSTPGVQAQPLTAKADRPGSKTRTGSVPLVNPAGDALRGSWKVEPKMRKSVGSKPTGGGFDRYRLAQRNELSRALGVDVAEYIRHEEAQQKLQQSLNPDEPAEAPRQSQKMDIDPPWSARGGRDEVSPREPPRSANSGRDESYLKEHSQCSSNGREQSVNGDNERYISAAEALLRLPPFSVPKPRDI